MFFSKPVLAAVTAGLVLVLKGPSPAVASDVPTLLECHEDAAPPLLATGVPGTNGVQVALRPNRDIHFQDKTRWPPRQRRGRKRSPRWRRDREYLVLLGSALYLLGSTNINFYLLAIATQDLKTPRAVSPPEKWEYTKMKIAAGVKYEEVYNLSAGSPSEWVATEIYKARTRTSRKALYEIAMEAAQETSRKVTTNVQAAMEVGFSFPIKFISVGMSVSSSFSREVKQGVRRSSKAQSRAQNAYEEETKTFFESSVKLKCAANAEVYDLKGRRNPDMVVVKETWTIGHKEFKVQFNCLPRPVFKKKQRSVTDFVWDIRVDYKWYRLPSATGSTLSIHESQFRGEALLDVQTHDFGEQWRFDDDGKHLVNRWGQYLITYENANHPSFVQVEDDKHNEKGQQ